jgi:hypothetical protein
MNIFRQRYGLTRDQVLAIVFKTVRVGAKVAEGAGADNADALRFKTLSAWELAQLRRALAEKITAKP